MVRHKTQFQYRDAKIRRRNTWRSRSRGSVGTLDEILDELKYRKKPTLFTYFAERQNY